MSDNTPQIRPSKKGGEESSTLPSIDIPSTSLFPTSPTSSTTPNQPSTPPFSSNSTDSTTTPPKVDPSSATVMVKIKKPSIVINPIYDNLLTLILILEIIGLLYIFVVVEKDLAAVITMAITTVITACGVSISRGLFKAIAHQIGAKKALEKQRNVRKFIDQGWQFVIHFSMTCFELYILWDKPWLTKTETVWDDTHIRPTGAVQMLYLLQLGIRMWSSFSHRFVEAKHKDYILMYTHHVVTIALLGGSYQGGFYKIGTLVLVVHNGSDIFVDLLKLSNYMDLAGRQYCFLTELLFGIHLITWSVCRLWYFPFRIINSSWFEHQGCEFDCQLLRALLHILLVMHVWWFYLFLRIAYRLLTKKSAHAAGREEYEGSSDEEEGKKKLRTHPPTPTKQPEANKDK